MTKAAPRLMKFANAEFQPRFEYGDQAQAAHQCGDAKQRFVHLALGASLTRPLTEAEQAV